MSAGAHACELSQPPGESEKVKFAYPLDRLVPARDAQPGVDRFGVGVARVEGQEELRGDLALRESLFEQAQLATSFRSSAGPVGAPAEVPPGGGPANPSRVRPRIVRCPRPGLAARVFRRSRRSGNRSVLSRRARRQPVAHAQVSRTYHGVAHRAWSSATRTAPRRRWRFTDIAADSFT